MSAIAQPPPTRVAVSFTGLKGEANVVFFGKSIGSACQRCGAHDQTPRGHRYCAHVSCPIALIEFKRRKRKRTSSLERGFLPRLRDATTPAKPQS